MDNADSVQAAWAAYQQSLAELYAPSPQEVERTTRGEASISIEQLDERGEEVVLRSQELGDVLIVALETDALDQRELAGWKLLASAAYDLSAAGDLVAAEQAGPEAATVRSARSAVVAAPELKEVMEAPLEGGAQALVPASRAAHPKDPQAAQAQLTTIVATFLDEIPDAVGGLSQKVVKDAALTALPIPGNELVKMMFQGIAGSLPADLSGVLSKAAQLLAEALRKLQAALGEDLQQYISQEVVDWLKEVQENQSMVTALLDKLYETGKIDADVHDALAQASASTTAERYNQASVALEDLMARYQKTGKILENLLRVLAFVKTPLLAAVPWGPVGVYGTYVTVFAYGILSGGDYLDWYRSEAAPWLDRVDGLRTVVNGAVQD